MVSIVFSTIILSSMLSAVFITIMLSVIMLSVAELPQLMGKLLTALTNIGISGENALAYCTQAWPKPEIFQKSVSSQNLLFSVNTRYFPFVDRQYYVC